MISGLKNGLVIGSIIAICSCHNNAPADNSTKVNHKNQVKLMVETFKTTDGWGYSILADDSIYIKQSIIPAVQGLHAFASETDAFNVGNLIIKKIKSHQKPTIYIADLKELNIIK